MSDPEYLTAAGSFRNDPAYDHLLPLNISSLAVAWNTELAERLNESLRKYREDAAYYQMKNTYFGKLM